MSEAIHRTELTADGYEKIEASIQKIEDLAYTGVFNTGSVTSRFYQISNETKHLRQILREVLFIVPAPGAAPSGGNGDAA